ncbi:MAG TPA: helix-turn-helix transcriptional regulator [Rhodocyclaceae bacterium]|jgi:transcriptional regulator with XRE-family HTH domain|nr:helix-turn-helix transcriptional regulator [Rhodocyclaceae bacterium]
MAPIINTLFKSVKQYPVLTLAQQKNKFADMRYGERLRAARQATGLTQALLSEKSGVLQSLISQLETSLTATGSEYTNRLARAMAINPDWLSDEIGGMFPSDYKTHDPKLVAAMKIMEDMPEYARDEAIKSIASIKKLTEHRQESSTGTED